MSTLDVKLRKLTTIEPHPNADRLELAVIGGYRAVVQKGIHKEGDLILYIPEDSMFTDYAIVKMLGIETYLTGKQKNRVKAIKLRGVLSQGIVIPLTAFWDFLIQFETAMWSVDVADISSDRMAVFEAGLIVLDVGDSAFIYKDRYQTPGQKLTERDWKDVLKIEKYEEDIPIHMQGRTRKWPSFLPKYDVENIKRPESMNVIEEGEQVIATEKLHGTNMAVAIGPDENGEETIFVCSRNHALLEDEDNVYWRAAKKYDLIEKLKKIKTMIEAGGRRCSNVSIHGEVVGVQDLKYGFSKGEIGFYAFDIRTENSYVDPVEFFNLCEYFEIPTVPEIYIGPFDYTKLSEIAEGNTKLSDAHIREGVVVKPVSGRTDTYGNRIQFKFVSEAYLTRKGGTELH